MIILRRLYSRRPPSVKYLRPVKPDPGISQRKKIFDETQEGFTQTDFEELESDFMSVHKSHREHIEQMETWREKEKYLIVKQKYFKEKFPNFLTCHDKEQIRYLHNSDPEEWSIEKLSEGFPALPDIIEKIVKNKWTKKNQAKIIAHDKAVIQHWTDFKQGKLNNLSQELKEHLQKFSTRSLNFKPFEMPHNKGKIIQSTREMKTPGEFSEIIASYQRLKSKNANKNERENQDQDLEHFDSNTENNTKAVAILEYKNSRKDHRLLTFKELQHRVEKDISSGKHVSEQDKLILKESRLPIKEDFNTTVPLKPEEISNIVEHRHQTNSYKVGFVQKTNKDLSHLIYPEKIIIPKGHYKKGYTYKLNDCYYDCDGEFLYRVPGMS